MLLMNARYDTDIAIFQELKGYGDPLYGHRIFRTTWEEVVVDAS